MATPLARTLPLDLLAFYRSAFAAGDRGFLVISKSMEGTWGAEKDGRGEKRKKATMIVIGSSPGISPRVEAVVCDRGR